MDKALALNLTAAAILIISFIQREAIFIIFNHLYLGVICIALLAGFGFAPYKGLVKTRLALRIGIACGAIWIGCQIMIALTPINGFLALLVSCGFIFSIASFTSSNDFLNM
tara:strand:+ start:168 stop:500 length:333 start_codon:yes stop_codon:yes gene_type:complete